MQWSIQQQVILGRERGEGEWGRDRERVGESIKSQAVSYKNAVR